MIEESERKELLEDLVEFTSAVMDGSKLNEREKMVLLARYGVNEDEPKNYRQISLRWHVTEVRIRQIEKRAFQKIQNCRCVDEADAAEIRQMWQILSSLAFANKVVNESQRQEVRPIKPI